MNGVHRPQGGRQRTSAGVLVYISGRGNLVYVSFTYGFILLDVGYEYHS